MPWALSFRPQSSLFESPCLSEYMIRDRIYRCPSWMSSGGEHVSATSSCLEDGTWSSPEAAPPGDLLFPASLPAPDSHPASACSCPSLSLGYNPNTEPGTQFHCSEAVTWDSLPVILAASARCYLMCGYILTATVYCR